MSTNNQSLLQDCVLYVYENELESVVDQLAAMTGATIFDKLVPFLTTHIICLKESVQLRTALNRMYSQTMEGAGSAKAAFTTDQSPVELATVEWLKQCLVKQRVLSTGDFKPEVLRIQVDQVKKLQPAYSVKKNLFNDATFAIVVESYQDGGDDTAMQVVEMIRRQLIENGGRIVSSNSKANYVIFEDGFDSEVWKKIASAKGDYMERSIVHQRWVEACIKENQIFDHINAYHLCPLPHRVPLRAF